MNAIRTLAFSMLLLFCLVASSEEHAITFHHGDGSGPNATTANAINDYRQVAGYIGGEILTSRGFVWHNGTFVDIFTAVPSNIGQDTKVFGINDLGQTVGYVIYMMSGGGHTTSGFVRGKYGNVTLLNLVHGQFIPFPTGINDFGKIVGSYSDSSKTYGFLRRANGSYKTIKHQGSALTYAQAINSRSTIAGYYQDTTSSAAVGFVYRENHITTTFQCTINGTPQSTIPTGINNYGQIVGRCGDQNFVRDRFGHISLIDLSVLGADVVARSPIVTGVNDYGDIVGYWVPPFPVVFGRFSFVIYNAVKTY